VVGAAASKRPKALLRRHADLLHKLYSDEFIRSQSRNPREKGGLPTMM
jgi:hypothetical protein